MLETVYQLVIVKGPKLGRVYSLTAPTFTIGRDPAADIVLDEPDVSRMHARLIRMEEGYRLEDLGSTNGTFVAGRNISAGPILLEPGQEVQVGSSLVMIYQLAEVVEADVTTVLAEPEAPVVPQELLITAATATEPHDQSEPVDPMLPPDFDDLPAAVEAPFLPVSEEADDAPPPAAEPDVPTDEPDLPVAEPDVLTDEPDLPAVDLLNFPELPELSDLPDMPDLPDLTEAVPELPAKKAARVIPAAEPIAAQPASGGNSTKRIVGILAAVLLILMCCCCGLLVFMYQWGGDWLLRQMELLP